MASTYREELCERLREVERLGIHDEDHKKAKFDVLHEAADHPRAAVECPVPIAEMLKQGFQSYSAQEKFSDFRDVETSDVRDAALSALEAVADVRPAAVGTPDVVRILADVSGGGPSDVRRRVFTLLGRGGGHADDVTVEQHLLDAVEGYVTEDGWSDDVSPAAVEAVGGFVAAGSQPQARLVAVLETAFETDIPAAQQAAAGAAGRGLTAESPPVDRLRELLESALAASTLAAKHGAAVGACRTLSGDESARAVGESVLEELLSSDDPEVRETVPEAVGDTVGDATVEAAERQADLLSRALDDDAANVRVAAVVAAREALDARESAVDSFGAVLETALVERAGEAHDRAVDELGDEDVLRTFGEVTDTDAGQIQEAFERRIVDDPRQGGSGAAITRIERFDDYFRPADASERDEDDEETDPNDGPDVEEEGARLAQQTRPSALEQLVEQADGERDRAVVVEAIHTWFRRQRLGMQETVTLWGALITAWEEGSVDVRQRVLDATATGVTRGHVMWTVAEDLLNTARQSDVGALREAALVAVGRLLQQRVVDWDTVGAWVLATLDDCDVDARRGGVEALGRSLASGAIGWEFAKPYLTDAREFDEPAVAEEAVRAVGAGLYRGTVEWEAVRDFLETARESNDTPVAEMAVRAVGAGLEGTVEWEAVADFLETVRESDDPPVVEETVRAVATGALSSSADHQDTVRILSAIANDSPEVSGTVASAVAALLEEGTDLTPELNALLTDLLQDGSPLARFSVLRGLYTRAGDGDLYDVTTVLETSLEDGEDGLRALTLQILDTSVTAETADETALTSLLETALTDRTPDVRERAIETVETAITHRTGSLNRLRELLVDTLTDATAPTKPRRAAVEALIDTRHVLAIDDAYLDALVDAATADPPVRRAVVDGAGTLLADGHTDGDHGRRLTALLWDVVTDAAVRKTAAIELADAQNRGDLNGPVEDSTGIQRALATEQFSPARRTALVELVAGTTQPVMPGFSETDRSGDP